jgi:hypothetical protein
MQWFWTDDLAAVLVEHVEVSPERLTSWCQRPVAYAAPEGAEALDVARALIQPAVASDAA